MRNPKTVNPDYTEAFGSGLEDLIRLFLFAMHNSERALKSKTILGVFWAVGGS